MGKLEEPEENGVKAKKGETRFKGNMPMTRAAQVRREEMTPVVQKHTGDLDTSKGSEERSSRGGRKRRKGDSFEKSDRAAEVWAGARAESPRGA